MEKAAEAENLGRKKCAQIAEYWAVEPQEPSLVCCSDFWAQVSSRSMGTFLKDVQRRLENLCRPAQSKLKDAVKRAKAPQPNH